MALKRINAICHIFLLLSFFITNFAIRNHNYNTKNDL